MGEFLVNAQGEDVVAGVRTPMPISQMKDQFPEAYAEFEKVCSLLENHYRDMQDMEFNMSMGFDIIAPAEDAEAIASKYKNAKVVGRVEKGKGVLFAPENILYEHY